MCTVSFIPLQNNRYCLTSNRDEWFARATLHPVTTIINGLEVVYPKDVQAGGTWIASSVHGRVCCLLNGAFVRHERQLPYVLSRGKVLLQAFEYEDINTFFEQVSLAEVEPFTLIIMESVGDGLRLYEFRWDAVQKHLRELSVLESHIWSSATLYEPKIRIKKENWFADRIVNNALDSPADIFKFHANTNDFEDGKKMVLEDILGLQTVSITQVQLVVGEEFSMVYHDLLSKKETSVLKLIDK